MVTETEITGFLKSRNGKASLNEVAEGLNIPKYGPNSAYALLQAMKTKGTVEREGELWALCVVEVKLPLPRESAGTVEAAAKLEAAEETTPEVEKLMKAMAETLADAMKTAQTPQDEWELATKPMTTKIDKKEDKLGSFVLRPDSAPEAKKPLVGFPTGTFIDDLFLAPEGNTLSGLPIVGQFAITGLPGAGKSILVEEISVKVAASGRKVLYVTAEDTWKSATPRFDLQSRLKQKADLLGLDWKRIHENLFVLDTVAYPELREWNIFAETYRYLAEKEKIELAIIDSVTILESYRGALKYRVMELARYNQVNGITSFFVNQRSAENWDTYDIEGCIGLAHNLDGTIIIDYERVYWQDQQVDLALERGGFARIARVLDCRICNFKRRRVRIDVTSDGFVRVMEPAPKRVEAEK